MFWAVLSVSFRIVDTSTTVLHTPTPVPIYAEVQIELYRTNVHGPRKVLQLL